MAVGVVDRLEVVDVQQRERDPRRLRLAGEPRRELVAELAAIGGPGQRVGLGEHLGDAPGLIELLVRGLHFGKRAVELVLHLATQRDVGDDPLAERRAVVQHARPPPFVQPPDPPGLRHGPVVVLACDRAPLRPEHPFVEQLEVLGHDRRAPHGLRVGWRIPLQERRGGHRLERHLDRAVGVVAPRVEVVVDRREDRPQPRLRLGERVGCTARLVDQHALGGDVDEQRGDAGLPGAELDRPRRDAEPDQPPVMPDDAEHHVLDGPAGRERDARRQAVGRDRLTEEVDARGERQRVAEEARCGRVRRDDAKRGVLDDEPLVDRLDEGAQIGVRERIRETRTRHGRGIGHNWRIQ